MPLKLTRQSSYEVAGHGSSLIIVIQLMGVRPRLGG
jgi:hypothetical protein